MSSTYVHYGTPSSLSTDYAVLSHYAAAHSLTAHDAPPTEEPPLDSEDALDAHDTNGVAIPGRAVRPRLSFTSIHRGQFNPSLSAVPDAPTPIEPPTENTPLLLSSPAVRIEEECDAHDAEDPPPTSTVFREEFEILTQYTLPVFGYVLALIVVLLDPCVPVRSNQHDRRRRRFVHLPTTN